MTIEEQLEYIVNKFKAELQEDWKVEIVDYCSVYTKDGYEIERLRLLPEYLYLHITDGRYHYQYNLRPMINDLYKEIATVSDAYTIIKADLKYSYLQMLFKEI